MDNGIMVYASDAFSREMFLREAQGSRNASTCLGEFIEMVCPGFKKTVGRRWSTLPLLQQHRGNCLRNNEKTFRTDTRTVIIQCKETIIK